MQKDKLKAAFHGVAIGDMLGLPFECKYNDYGYIDNYVNTMHSDDTQLTCAVAEAMIQAKNFNLETQITAHINAYKTSTFGWGKSTENSIAKLTNPDLKISQGSGLGNGVAMKMTPIGAWLTLQTDLDEIVKFAKLTHNTSIGVGSGLSQAFAIKYCLTTENFNNQDFIKVICAAADLGKFYVKDSRPSLSERFIKLNCLDNIKEDFGYGTPFAYDSLPFSYAYFLRNPKSIKSLYDVASAGGDTDTNSSLVGSLLGALNGTDIFPDHLTSPQIIEHMGRIAEMFFNTFFGTP